MMRLLACLVLLFGSGHIYSQTCNSTLYGTVIDFHDGSPLPGATVIVAGPELAVVSDLDGNFIVTDLCNTTYTLQISHPECATQAFTLELRGNLTKKFRLEHHLEELNQVMVTAKAFTTKSETLLENTITQKTIENNSSGSLGDVLSSLSGVSSLTTGNAVVKPVINGLHSSRVTIINNGVRMQDQEWGPEHSPNIDLNTAGYITVIKGASALQYSGDAIGGVVVAEPVRTPLIDSLYGKSIFTAATNGRGTSFTSTLTKSYQNGWYGTVQGTIKRFGDFETPDYVLSNTGIFERDMSVRLGVNRLTYGIEGYYSLFKNEIGILRASHVGGAEDQITAIESNTPLIVRDFTYKIDVPRQDVTHHLARVSAFNKFDNFGKVTVQYDFQKNNRFEYDIRRGSDADKPSVDLELTSHHLSTDLVTDFSEAFTVKTGFSGEYQNNFADPTTGVRRLIPDYDQYKAGIYAIADLEISEKLLLEAGGRWDYTYMDVFKFYRTSFWESRGYDVLFPNIVVEDLNDQVLTNPELTFNNFSATAGFTYRFSNVYQLFFNYSLATRAPNVSELFSEGLHQGASRIELGDLRFVPETANKLSLTLQRKGDNFSFAVNPYINFIEDFMLIEPTGIQQTIRGNFQVWEYRQTRATLAGIDVDFSAKITENLQFNHQFAIVKGYDKVKEEPLINMPPASIENELAYRLKKFKNFRFSLKSAYVFAQNEYPNNNFDVFLPQSQTFETVDVSTPPAAYHLLHADTGLQLKLNSKTNLDLGLKVSNLFNTSYRDYLNRLRYYADDLGRNFSLHLKINY